MSLLKGVVLFTQENCPACAEVKEWLDGRGTKYQVRDINDPELDKEIASTAQAATIQDNGGVLPVLMLGGCAMGIARGKRAIKSAMI